MFFKKLTKQPFFTIIWLAIICVVVFLTYQRIIKQDDGWYASYVFKWMQKIGNTDIKSFWDYTDSNDYDMGCSFVVTLLQGTFFSLFGVSVVSMKALNSLEAILLCGMLYVYLRNENKAWALGAVMCFIGWNMVNMHFFNRPELPAATIAVWILYLLAYSSDNKRSIFTAYFLTAILLDMHPLSLFVVAGLCVSTFIRQKDTRLMAVIGWASGMVVYFAGNYLVNGSLGIFTGAIMGIKTSLGDHYLPILDTGISDILNITRGRFSFITKATGISGYIKLGAFIATFVLAIYLLLTKKLVKNKMLCDSSLTYVVFIVLSTFLSEATSNGFRLYHAITFGTFYFALLYAIYHSVRIRAVAFIGLLPFLMFMKDTVLKAKEDYSYHKSNHYYRSFIEFNDQLPDTGKVLMRPTHAIFNYHKHIHFDYTYGLLRYMHKEQLSFKDAVIKKRYDYLVLDDQFEPEFFTDIPSPYRKDPSPYYYPLRNTGLTSAEFRQLVASRFLSPVDTLDDMFAGRTILYKVNY